MRRRKLSFLWILIPILLIIAVVCILLARPEWGFDRPVSVEEQELRLAVVEQATAWLGCREEDGSHEPIIDVYNSHLPLARGYAVQYTDEWCSTYASAVAIACGLTDIIPTECGCERHIELFETMGCWVEADAYIPLPGDYIFYHWDCTTPGDCDHWSDHVGIVVGTWNGWIKVIEGNKNEDVSYRYLPIDDNQIRGFGVPNYGA